MSLCAMEQDPWLELQSVGVCLCVCARACACMHTRIQASVWHDDSFTAFSTKFLNLLTGADDSISKCKKMKWKKLFVFNYLSLFFSFLDVFCLVDSSVREARHTKVQWFPPRKLRLRPSCPRPGLVPLSPVLHCMTRRKKIFVRVVRRRQQRCTW